MWKNYIFTILMCHGVFGNIISNDDRHFDFHVCKNNRSIAVQLLFQENVETELGCKCHADTPMNDLANEDYVLTPGIGLHKLHTTAKNWNDARKTCNEERAHLAIINSVDEQHVLLSLLDEARGSITGALNTEEALIGIHDLFKEGEWVTVFGESLYATGYSHWSKTYFGGQPDNYLGNQNCGAIVINGGMDDVFCHDKFAFFCEQPVNC